MKLSSALAALALFSCSEEKPYEACVKKVDVCSKKYPYVDCVSSCKPYEGLDDKCPNGYALEKTSTKPTNEVCYDILPTEL